VLVNALADIVAAYAYVHTHTLHTHTPAYAYADFGLPCIRAAYARPVWLISYGPGQAG
jgi:hypothetical protein